MFKYYINYYITLINTVITPLTHFFYYCQYLILITTISIISWGPLFLLIIFLCLMSMAGLDETTLLNCNLFVWKCVAFKTGANKSLYQYGAFLNPRLREHITAISIWCPKCGFVPIILAARRAHLLNSYLYFLHYSSVWWSNSMRTESTLFYACHNVCPKLLVYVLFWFM